MKQLKELTYKQYNSLKKFDLLFKFYPEACGDYYVDVARSLTPKEAFENWWLDDWFSGADELKEYFWDAFKEGIKWESVNNETTGEDNLYRLKEYKDDVLYMSETEIPDYPPKVAFPTSFYFQVGDIVALKDAEIIDVSNLTSVEYSNLYEFVGVYRDDYDTERNTNIGSRRKVPPKMFVFKNLKTQQYTAGEFKVSSFYDGDFSGAEYIAKITFSFDHECHSDTLEGLKQVIGWQHCLKLK